MSDDEVNYHIIISLAVYNRNTGESWDLAINPPGSDQCSRDVQTNAVPMNETTQTW